jgi:uncharacterized protein YndB with AHSA1/START domain
VQEIDERAHSAAPPERVFALLADARTWPRWGPFDSAEIEPGTPSPGLGEERRLTTGRVRNHERVVAFEPPRLFAYELLAGLPIRDYRAEVTLTPAGGGGTDIRWHSKFSGKLPGFGWVVARTLRRFIEQTAQGLARGAEAEEAPPA